MYPPHTTDVFHNYTDKAQEFRVHHVPAEENKDAFVSVWAPENDFWFYLTPEQARALAIQLIEAAAARYDLTHAGALS